ncbi:hypothetical protein [Thalassolituus pacificus]|uniref:Uncharacterized protein n=1 Tax=Thalassolituus pacificus TaxID=2975440 RepID=A0A9X3AFE6_9GAMM|nr:hypothetical protein [Thalassolituus pacificus]MCT7358577.1 hypothetical protein [Thalassolituus pacificus]
MGILLFFFLVSFKFKSGVDLVILSGLLFTIVALYIRRGFFVISGSIVINFIILYVFFVLSLIVTTLNGMASVEYLLFTFKFLLLAFFSYMVVLVYFELYGRGVIYRVVHDIYWSLVVHAAIIVLMFVSPTIKLFVYEYSSVSDLMFTDVGRYRIAGFSGGGSALLSFFQSIAIGLSVYLIRYGKCSSWMLLFANVTVILSVFLTGRVGLLVVVFFYGYYFLYLKYQVFFILLLFTLFMVFLSSGDVNNSPIYLVYDRVLAEFGLSEKISQSSSTLEALFTMLHFPPEMESLNNFLFGTTSAGRTEGLWLNADIGYMKNWYMSGVIGLFFIIFYYFWLLYLLCKSVRLTDDGRFIKNLSLLVIIMTLIMNFKEDVLAARHLYSMIMILVFLVYTSYLKMYWVEHENIV